MAQTDPRTLDQIMVQSWNSVAQQLRLHNRLSSEPRALRRRRTRRRAVQNEPYRQTRRQQQSIRLEQWRWTTETPQRVSAVHLRRDHVLADTAAAGGRCATSSLLQGWW